MISLVPPGFLVGLSLCALYAGLFHVWGGRTVRDLVAFLLAATIGFSLGQAVGALLNLPLLQVGQIHVMEATLVAWLAMIGVRELRLGQPEQNVDNF